MERAPSMALQGPWDDNIVPLLHLAVFLCLAMLVMLFIEKVYMAIIILVKLFRKRPGRHPERQYIWNPIREKDKILIQIPIYNETEVHLSIEAACRVSWTSDRIIIQKLDDSTDPIIKEHERNREEEVMEDENERNQGEEIRTTEEHERNQEEEIRTTEEEGRRKRRGDTIEERKSQAKRRKEGPKNEGGSKVEATNDDRKREETGEGTVEVNVNQDDEGRKKRKQCRWVRICMAMGCAAIFTSALILFALANIRYVEETVYLFPT